MTLDESWAKYREVLRDYYGIPITDNWLVNAVDYGRELLLDSGQLRYGGPGDWFRSIRWSQPAWTALHGAEGHRGRG